MLKNETIKKNLKRNLNLPISRRLGISDIETKISRAKSHAAKIALLTMIHHEIAGEVAKINRREDLYSRIGSISGGFIGCQIESAGYTADLTKYRERIFSESRPEYQEKSLEAHNSIGARLTETV